MKSSEIPFVRSLFAETFSTIAFFDDIFFALSLDLPPKRTRDSRRNLSSCYVREVGPGHPTDKSFSSLNIKRLDDVR